MAAIRGSTVFLKLLRTFSQTQKMFFIIKILVKLKFEKDIFFLENDVFVFIMNKKDFVEKNL